MVDDEKCSSQNVEAKLELLQLSVGECYREKDAAAGQCIYLFVLNDASKLMEHLTVCL